ncbi:hypothetical protein COO91_06721 [Nostoc flagelliforme CCNUN1]|uniref:Uncharacterized protein n=1 Tax=Nostoc flagelliforme CCNUN1 TaxID=2038116 RepID=A0A2K8SZ23_9NOSO|nr:hypothetical protein COO91_06721 [Nostoc flagelliforme CCNUN1]
MAEIVTLQLPETLAQKGKEIAAFTIVPPPVQSAILLLR